MIAAEYAGVAALEPQHAMAGARQLDQTVRDIVLVGRRPATALAREFEPRLCPRQCQDPAIHKRVVNDDIGLRKAGECIECQQARIAGPRSGEPDLPGREHGRIGAQRGDLAPAGHLMSPRTLTACPLPESDGDRTGRRARSRGSRAPPMPDRPG